MDSAAASRILIPNPQITGTGSESGAASTEGWISEEAVIAIEYREVHGKETLLGLLKEIKARKEITFEDDGPVRHSFDKAIMGAMPGGDLNDKSKALGGDRVVVKEKQTPTSDEEDQAQVLKEYGVKCVDLDGDLVGLSPPDFVELGAVVGCIRKFLLASVDEKGRMKAMRAGRCCSQDCCVKCFSVVLPSFSIYKITDWSDPKRYSWKDYCNAGNCCARFNCYPKKLTFNS